MVFHIFPRGCRRWMSQEHAEEYTDLPTTSYENVFRKTQENVGLKEGTHNSVSRLRPVSYCLWLFHKLFRKENDVFSLSSTYSNFLVSTFQIK